MEAHPDEIPIDDGFVAGLIRTQAPHWAALPLRRLASSGTDNTIYRLGDALSVRLPRRPSAIAPLSKELNWLAHLQDLPLEVPAPRFRGHARLGPDTGPELGIAFEFGVLDWMEGRIARPDRIADWQDTAGTLAGFLKALHRKDTTGAPRAGACNAMRGVALSALGTAALSAIDTVADEICAGSAWDLWDKACAAAFTGRPVWLHGDLKADNLIARDGRLQGVIDWGLAAVGDPAADYATAWFWIDPAARATFRDRLEVDGNDWLRAQGWALYGAVIALSYYRGGRNEALCRQSRLTLSRLGLLP